MKRLCIYILSAFVFSALLYSADDLKGAMQFQDALVKVAEKAFPSVVVIKIKNRVGNNSGDPLIFEDIFGNYYYSQKKRQQPETVQTGQGSGFIVREDGHILTANHVVAGGSEIVATLHDGREFPARVVGRDKLSDLALIKIDAPEKLPVLKFADSDKVKVGHIAIAVGTPFTLDYTMTLGIVSQKGRSAGINMYENYIQTDAVINPGNSGGPLLDIKGEVIGINDFILAGGSGITPVNSGLGFAIPANMASDIVEQLIRNKEVTRPWLGVSMQSLTAQMKEQFKVKSGVLVREVFSGHPAAECGIEPGDIITQIGKLNVNTPQEVQMAVLKYKPGDKIPLALFRDGKRMDLKLTAGNQKAYMNSDGGKTASPSPGSVFESLGIKLGEKQGNVYISEVKPNSPAGLGNLVKGMRIYGVNRYKINSISDAEKAASINPDSILLYVEDAHSRYFIVLSK